MACYQAAILAAAALLALLGSADAYASLAREKRQSAVAAVGMKVASGGVQTTCPRARHPVCQEGVPAPFRTADGSCAKGDGVVGMSGTPYKRKLAPQYEDGVHAERLSVVDNKPLPSARLVANKLTPDADRPNAIVNNFFMEWAQAFAHDITLIDAPFPSPNGGCCMKNATGKDLLGDSCARIEVPKDDAYFPAKGVGCLAMQRAGAQACAHEHKEQRNMVTHYVDASLVYGSDPAKAKLLRELRGGRLRSRIVNGEEFLPVDPTGNSIAGDVRVDITVLMVTLQTVLLREHNSLADGLAAVNPHWDDERLYQEARRIVIAQWQHMTYKEWLPWLIGFEAMDELNLWPVESGYSYDYTEQCDPRTSNDFAASAYRSFHSLITNNLWLDRHGAKQGNIIDTQASEVTKPGMLLGVTEGMLYQPAQQQDQNEAKEIRDRMFFHDNKKGGDLIATDIARGRDNGLPAYNYYRSHCGLNTADKWEDFTDLISKENIETLKSLYASPADVDFYVGGMLERRDDPSITASIVSPVFRCVVANQFRRYKECDPYFFDLDGPALSFTLDQLDAIRDRTASKMLCDNVPGLEVVPNNAFINLGVLGNPEVRCTDLPDLDLNLWKEDPAHPQYPETVVPVAQPFLPIVSGISHQVERILRNLF